MREKAIGIMMLLSLLLLLTACSHQKEVQNTIEANVTGMGCCPPSVVKSFIEQVNGVSKVDIKASGSSLMIRKPL